MLLRKTSIALIGSNVLLICFTNDFSYKDRFLASLPAARRASADFTRPVFMAVAFYLSAKKQKVHL